VPLIAAPSLLIRLFNGSLHRSPHATTLQGKRIHIRRSGDDAAAHLDGEPVTLATDLHIHIRPKSLNVLIPSGGRRI
jgi:diacylglycerol kinase family enzyme